MTKAVACPGCKKRDQFVVLAQHVSIEPQSLRVRVVRVIVVCSGCKAAVAVDREGASLYKSSGVDPAAGNGAPAPAAAEQQVDTDLPRMFRR